MGRRLSSLVLFATGFVVLASLGPLVAVGPALTSFFAGVLILARVPASARI